MTRVALPEEHTLTCPQVDCIFCGAYHWLEERLPSSTRSTPAFRCCGLGKIKIPTPQLPPDLLVQLLTSRHTESTEFKRLIRSYNNAFAWTSLGANIDPLLASGRQGVYTFRLQGEMKHFIGTLLPQANRREVFAQIHIMDATEAERVHARLDMTSGLSPALILSLQQMLETHNPYVQFFRNNASRSRSPCCVQLKILNPTTKDPRTHNIPTCNEVAVLLVDDPTESATYREVIIEHRDGSVKRINEKHPFYLPLRYPIIFPFGEQGWSESFPYVGYSSSSSHSLRANKRQRLNDGTFDDGSFDPAVITGRGSSTRVSQAQYFMYLLHYGRSFPILHFCGRLFQEFIVDAFAAIEQNRLNFIRTQQSKLRADLYTGLHDALQTDPAATAQNLGTRVILPSSFQGGPRQMSQLYQDAMALCRHYGKPDLFVTFTCNPAWNDISRQLLSGQTAVDRPDIVARVFNLKLRAFMDDLLKRRVLGHVVAYTYVIEFQKRGLPHCHILLILRSEDKIRTIDDIDRLVTAETPNPSTFPNLHRIITSCLLHGPCGQGAPNAPCMVNGTCAKKYPRPFLQQTTVAQDGYPQYRRRDSGLSITRRDVRLDNQWVVPFNPYLASKYAAHINVEVCSSIRATKYIYKYVYKGSDQATAQLSTTDNQHNEVQQYVDARYVSAAEASWRIFMFRMHRSHPSVQRLQLHLPGQQTVTFSGSAEIADILTRNHETTLTQFFSTNAQSAPHDEPCSSLHLLYTEFPTKFAWNSSTRQWNARKNRSFSIGRMYYAGSQAGERYYLWLLLSVVSGSTSFEDLRSYEGVVYTSFKNACQARGLLVADNDLHLSLSEASTFASATRLRVLFTEILLLHPDSNPADLWTKHKTSLCDDAAYTLRQTGVEAPTRLQIESVALRDISRLLQLHEKSLEDFGLPVPSELENSPISANNLLAEELNYDISALCTEVTHIMNAINSEQLHVLEVILHAYESNSSQVFFIDGPGGTGKTFLQKLILNTIRSHGAIALAVASSGMAATLLPGGKTGHSRFKIPLDITQDSMCNIPYNSQLAHLIRQTRLILWDEAPMQNRLTLEAVDRSLQDVRRSTKPFGGIPIVLSGDFRQILPVIPGA